MNRLRLWILGTALGCFAAGMLLGTAIPRAAAAGGDFASAEERAAEEAYVDRFVADFGLDRTQEQQLRAVRMLRRQREMEALKAGFEQLPPALKSQVLAARSREKELTRGLLDDRQRRLYDERTGR